MHTSETFYQPRQLADIHRSAEGAVSSRPMNYTRRTAGFVPRGNIAYRVRVQYRRLVNLAFPKRTPKRQLALLLPGHNEELILATTIQSAIAAGQAKEDIFVVDDNSDDATREIAIRELGGDNVLSVGRSGKALAVQKALNHFDIVERYEWVHVADADSVFSRNYFRVYRRNLGDKRYVVAIGFVQSLKGNWISTYRAFSYTYGQQVYRRVQSWLGMVSVFPGPVTAFRTSILPKLEIAGTSIAEDFDITLQVHRKKLGKVLYIPSAVNYTQDPQNLQDFCKQSMRWYRGFFQGVKRYRVGLHGQKIDASIGIQLLQTALFLIQITVLVPLIIIMTHRWLVIPTALAADLIITSGIVVLSSFAAKRWSLFGMLPYYYILRCLEICMYFWAFTEIMILKRFETDSKGWSTEGRRYQINSEALREVASIS